MLIVAAALPVPIGRMSSELPIGAFAVQAIKMPVTALDPTAQASASYFRLPMRFDRALSHSKGGWDFSARGAGYAVFLSEGTATLALPPTGAGAPLAITMRLLGARHPTAVTGLDRLPGVTNQIIGTDPQQWQIGVPGYAKVEYRDVYQGVNAIFYGTQQQLEYDFVVAPGADPRDIAIAFDGASSVSLDGHGDLVIATPVGDIVQRAPRIYQEKDGQRQSIDGGYVVKKHRRVAFRVGSYDHRMPLVIDPVLTYSTYLGGTAGEAASGVATDAQGNVYVAGQTTSLDFPLLNAAQPTRGGGSLDAFVAKLNPAGDALVYATYLGGSGYEYAKDIAVDLDGNAYVTGSTVSRDFPTVRALQSTLKGFSDSFVTKLDPSGVIVYSTLLGGKAEDYGYGIAVDALGRAYVTGQTISPDFPTVNPLQSRLGGNVAFRSTDGGRTWATAQSGLSTTGVTALAIDPVNPAIVYAGTYGDGVFKSMDAGQTWSLCFDVPIPVRALAIHPTVTSTLYIATDNLLIRSTDGCATWAPVGLFGLNVTSLVIDPVTPTTIYAGGMGSGNLSHLFKTTNGGSTWTDVPFGSFIFSLVLSRSMPTTLYAGTERGVFKSTGGAFDQWDLSLGLPQVPVLALSVDPTNASIVYAATESGPFRTDSGGAQWVPVSPLSGVPTTSIAVAPSAPATIYAESYSSGGAVSDDAGASWVRIGPASPAILTLAVDPTAPRNVYVGGQVSHDAFLARLAADGSALEYSTYLGGSSFDYGNDVAVDSSGNAYVVGATSSDDFPTLNPMQTTFGGVRDLFVAKVSANGTLAYSTYLGGSAWEDGGTIAVDAPGQAHVAGYTLSSNFPTVRAQQAVFAGGGSDAFVTKLDATGAMVYSTFLGGSGSEMGPAAFEVGRDPVVSVAVTQSGDAFVTGVTSSTDFPTLRPLQGSHGGGVYDAFVAKLAPDGLLQFSTLLGGSGADSGRRLTVDSNGAVVIAGATSSVNFQTRNPLQGANAGSDDAFIVRIEEGAPDPTPPSTTINLSGTTGLGGWYRSSVVVMLAAADADGESGAAFVDYNINQVGFVRYSAPFTVATEGATTVLARATDNSGNVESPPSSAVIRIDTLAPVVSVSSPEPRDYLHSDTVTLNFSAIDASSGVAAGSPSATLAGTTRANGETIQLLTLPLGTHSLIVSASDVAGNSSQQPVTFRIVATIDSLIAAVNVYSTQGKIDSNTRKSLLAKLSDAKSALDRGAVTAARGSVRDFIDQCTAKSGKGIATDAAAVLVTDGQYVLTTL
jgi:Beta-propeller repeat/FIMAH domain